MKIAEMFSNFLRYLGSLVGEKVLFLVAFIIAARIIGPADYGVWTALSLILLYGTWTHFGIGNALSREISFYIGKNNFLEVEKIKNAAFTAIMFITIGIALIFSLVVFFLRSRFEPKVVIALLLVPSILVLQQIYDNARRFLSAVNNFKLVSELKIVRALVASILIILFVFRVSFIGIPLAFIGGYFVALIYICRRYPFHLRISFNIPKTLSLLKVGFTITLAMAFWDFFITVDRLLVYRLMGKIMLGYYSIASNLFDFLMLIPQSLGTIIYTYLAKRYGEKECIYSLRESICLSIRLLSYIVPGIIMIAYVFLPYIITFILPQYTPGITATQIVTLGIFPLSVSIICGYSLLVINKQLSYFFFLLIALVLKGVFAYILIIAGKGIEGVALGAVLIYVLFSMFMLLYVHSHFKEAILNRFKFLLQIYAPFAYMLFIFWSIHWLGSRRAMGFIGVFDRNLIMHSFLILFALLPLVYLFLQFLISTDRQIAIK